MKRILVKLTNPIIMAKTITVIILLGSIIGCDTYKHKYEIASAYAEQLEDILEERGFDTAIGSDEQIEYDKIKH